VCAHNYPLSIIHCQLKTLPCFAAGQVFDTPLSACDSVNKGFYESETSSEAKLKQTNIYEHIFFLRRGSVPAVFVCSSKSKSTVNPTFVSLTVQRYGDVFGAKIFILDHRKKLSIRGFFVAGLYSSSTCQHFCRCCSSCLPSPASYGAPANSRTGKCPAPSCEIQCW